MRGKKRTDCCSLSLRLSHPWTFPKRAKRAYLNIVSGLEPINPYTLGGLVSKNSVSTSVPPSEQYVATMGNQLAAEHARKIIYPCTQTLRVRFRPPRGRPTPAGAFPCEAAQTCGPLPASLGLCPGGSEQLSARGSSRRRFFPPRAGKTRGRSQSPTHP